MDEYIQIKCKRTGIKRVGAFQVSDTKEPKKKKESFFSLDIGEKPV